MEYLGGYAVHQFIKLNRHCYICVKTLTIPPPVPLQHDYAQHQSLVQLGDYTKQALVYISPTVKQLLEAAEKVFKTNEKDIMTTQNVLTTRVIACSSSGHHNIPDCHQAVSRILKTFFRVRITTLLQEKEKAKRKKFRCGKESRSITMRELVDK